MRQLYTISKPISMKHFNYFGEFGDFSYQKTMLYESKKEAEYKSNKLSKYNGYVNLFVACYSVEESHYFVNRCAQLIYSRMNEPRDLMYEETVALYQLYRTRGKPEEAFKTIELAYPKSASALSS